MVTYLNGVAVTSLTERRKVKKEVKETHLDICCFYGPNVNLKKENVFIELAEDFKGGNSVKIKITAKQLKELVKDLSEILNHVGEVT